MKTKKKPSQSDIELFRQSVGPIKRIDHDKVSPQPRRPAPIPRRREWDDASVVQDRLSDAFDPAEEETGEDLVFARNGIQHRELRKLRRGQYAIHGELDLHGMRAEEARQAVSQFLHQCRSRQVRCVRIIHGKGNGSHQQQPVLKRKINRWLRQRDEVLAFCSARAVDGGTGAVYVLLRRD